MFRPLTSILTLLAVNTFAQTAPELNKFVSNYCRACHGDGIERGSLNLDAISEDTPKDHWKTWEHAILRMDSLQMPPGDVPSIRRLTCTEYHNAIRDLLGLNIDVRELLPKDGTSHGFDNIAVDSLSSTLLNRYVNAASQTGSH